ncbi:MAG: hypothetical protein M3O35_18295 [Acidobacteriota bacterium]|nr:hypothetical protein [Acidobacteriota bacterium]
MIRLAALCLLCAAAPAQTIRIEVFNLFRAGSLRIAPAGDPILLHTGGRAIELEGGRSLLITAGAEVTSRSGGAADFELSVPGRISRRFHGVLRTHLSGRKLVAILEIDSELAVASAVAAESPPGASFEALKAQAVVTRSYYAAARDRHTESDFCDTTHCQFLRSPPDPASPAARAAAETRGLVLAWQGRTIPALFSAACGGSTRDFEEGDAYPYRSVTCAWCSKQGHGEVAGHRLGMCQRGAAGMGAEGASYRDILNHFFPSAAITHFPVASSAPFAAY